MVSIRLYTVIFVGLTIMSTLQAAFEYTGVLEEVYWIALGVIVLLSFVKASLVAGWFQHLRMEPRGITYVYLSGLVAAIALTVAASYSIT